MPLKEEKIVVVHPLITRPVRPIPNWHEWLARWQTAVDFQWMESLLHVGFNVRLEKGKYEEPEYDRMDRVIFYLSIADGWADSYSFDLPTDGDKEYLVGYDANIYPIEKTERSLRRQLARKAFDMLCPIFFKMELLEGGRHGEDFNHLWERHIVSEKLFPIIQHFFRAEKEKLFDGVKISNLSSRRSERSHNEQHAVTFLLNLATFLWKWKEPDPFYWGVAAEKEKNEKRFAAFRARVDAAKPWMVEVLSELNQLDLLQEWILELDEACLAKLREIACRAKIKSGMGYSDKDRPVATLDEACFAGSKAAWFLKEYELKTREAKRLEAIRDLERQREEVDQQFKKLTAQK